MKKYIVTAALLMFGYILSFAQQIDKQAYVKNYNAIMRAKSALEAERSYKELLINFGDYFTSLPSPNRDIPLYAVAYAFILENDTSSANSYISKLTDKPTLPSHLYGMAKAAQTQNLYTYQEGLLKKAITAYESLNFKPNPTADPLGVENNREKYGVLFYTDYARVLTKNGKGKLGLTYAKKAYLLNKKDKLAISTYATLLSDNKMFAKALPVLEEGILSGSADSTILFNHKRAYLAVKDRKGYETQLLSLKRQQTENIMVEMQKQMISEVAADFSLEDLSGKKWTLKELKGKTVVLDFWATWCAPCKKSFPAMQMAVNKYKSDSQVVFLFIHTWERQEGATEDARRYITAGKFDFTVLMDLKKDGKNQAITAYKASGIPAKFVIDPKGNIRFKLTGFSGSNEVAVAELSAMIELARKP